MTKTPEYELSTVPASAYTNTPEERHRALRCARRRIADPEPLVEVLAALGLTDLLVPAAG